jgi:hypothetical protein
LELGGAAPSWETVQLLAKALHVSCEEFRIEDVELPEPPAPRSVQEILGHKTLDMTMRIYAKVKGASKRQTVAKLSYAQGATAPDHLLQLRPAAGA